MAKYRPALIDVCGVLSAMACFRHLSLNCKGRGRIFSHLAYSALAFFGMVGVLPASDYCTTRVRGTARFKTVDPDVKVPVAVKLYVPCGVPALLFPPLPLFPPPPQADQVIASENRHPNANARIRRR
jgi:hypothetical protein